MNATKTKRAADMQHENFVAAGPVVRALAPAIGGWGANLTTVQFLHRL